MLRTAVVAAKREASDPAGEIYRPYCVEFAGDAPSLLLPYFAGRVLESGDVLLIEYDRAAQGECVDFRRVKRAFIRGWEGAFVDFLPLWSREYGLVKRDARGRPLYSYRVLVREVWSRRDLEDVLFLEQFHYADREAVKGVWRCGACGRRYRGVSRVCPYCGRPAGVLEKIPFKAGTLRILVAEKLDRREWEPRVLGFIMLTPVFPYFTITIGRGEALSNATQLLEDWLHPVPEHGLLRGVPRRLTRFYGFHGMMSGTSKQAVVRNMRVVVHPDYRSEGLGKLLLSAAEDYIRDRRAPDNKRRKHLFFSFARMGRFNPFHERAGFTYIGDAGEGEKTTPVFVKALTREGEERLRSIREALDGLVGRVLYVDYTPRVEGARIDVRGATVVYTVDVRPPGSDAARFILESYGVSWSERRLERVVFTDLSLTVEPGELLVVMGASGSGKTSVLKSIYYASRGERFPALVSGSVTVTARNPAVNIPHVAEAEYDESRSVIDNMVDAASGRRQWAVKLLNLMGIGDVPLLLSRPSQLSTGQLERFKLALLLARAPDLVLVDEFTAFLDDDTAVRVARRFAQTVKRMGATSVIVVNRRSVVDALSPDKVLVVGYGSWRLDDFKTGRA